MSGSNFNEFVPGVSPAIGGHMLYDKRFEIGADGISRFVKEFRLELLTDPSKADGMRAELAHEATLYQHLAEHGFSDMPEDFDFDQTDHRLTIRAYKPEDGWLWDPPTNDTVTKYADDILESLDSLAEIPPLTIPHESSSDLFLRKGWPKLFIPEVRDAVLARMDAFEPHLHDFSRAGSLVLRDILSGVETDWPELAQSAAARPATQLGHFDARPSNVAWHPEHGVRVIDWSWAANTVPHTDCTMFLIDLHKADVETRDLPGFDHHFDRGHAALLIGYWLARSITPGPDQNVRFHQFASAATAAALISS